MIDDYREIEEKLEPSEQMEARYVRLPAKVKWNPVCLTALKKRELAR